LLPGGKVAEGSTAAFGGQGRGNIDLAVRGMARGN
jgi:hypothetical protein